MPSRRVLFLGPTGVDKSTVLAQLAGFAEREVSRECLTIDFEGDFLSSEISLDQYLDQPVANQHERWQKAWTAFVEKNKEVTEEGYQGPDVFLALHGCYTRGYYGTRLVADPSEVARFRPHLIITLIDDIYDLWWRTEDRARGDPWKGRPTLEQLALARRVEAAFGDLVKCLSHTKPRHLLIAAAHPQRTVAQAIYGNAPEVIYLSFPISEPRHMLAKGDHSGIEEVDSFVGQAAQFERMNRSVSCVCPLAIDELPFVRFGTTADNWEEVDYNIGGGRTEKKKGFVFPRDDVRWDLRSFWPSDQCMNVPPNPGPPFLWEHLEAACGNIRSDVGWRDYRLAEQSDRLFVFNPVMNGEDRRRRGKNPLAHGVTAEIGHALAHGVPVYVFQDEKHDPGKEWAAWHDTIQGGESMRQGQAGSRLVWVNTLDDMFSILEPHSKFSRRA